MPDFLFLPWGPVAARVQPVKPSPQMLRPEHADQDHDHGDANPHGAPHAGTYLVGVAAPVLVHRRRHQCATSPCASWLSSITGGMAKVWCGAGDGTVHSRPRAPSQTRSVAFFFAK